MKHAVQWVVSCICCALSMSESARAELVPMPGKVDPRVRSAFYDPDQVYRLHAFVGYQIELVFEEGETFVGQGGGDLEAIAFGAHANHFILKPRAEAVDTNLVIYTNRRAYRIDYRVHSHDPDPLEDEVMYAVRFVYPPPPPDEAERVSEVLRAKLEAPESTRVLNHDYWFCGHKALRPVAASDDGVHTRITFASRAELPALFVLNDDGSESLLNFSVHDGDVVVHRVARRLIVRRGKLVGCIVNKGYQGSGERLSSGTVVPEVVRERKEREP